MKLPLLLLPTLALLVAAPASSAIVPPRDCGRMDIGTRTYNVKADQMPCADAKRFTRRYLGGTARKPRGYSCRKYSPSQTKLAFRCTKGTRTFFAIRR